MNLKSKLSLGFTLIELLIVIAIIGILAALIMTNVQGVRERARDSRRKADLSALKTSLRLYYNDQKIFPPDTSGPTPAIKIILVTKTSPRTTSYTNKARFHSD